MLILALWTSEASDPQNCMRDFSHEGLQIIFAGGSTFSVLKPHFNYPLLQLLRMHTKTNTQEWFYSTLVFYLLSQMLNHHEQNIDCHLFWLSNAITAQWQRFHTSRRRSKETWIWLTPMLYAQRLTKLLCLVGSSSCGVEQLLLLVYSG